MPSIERSVHVATSPDLAWAYLSDVAHLPSYVDALASVEPTGGEGVHVTAGTPGGPRESDAWVRADDAGRRLEWGSQAREDYAGWLTVTPDGDGSRVALGLELDHEDDDNSIGRSLAALQLVLEASG